MNDRTNVMSATALESGFQVMWYTVREVLGQGGFGITYLADDNNLDRLVAIKEYLPTSFAFRNQDSSVKPITENHGDDFAWGLGSFLKEAKTLAKFNHDNIVKVHSVFEHNNTAYMVMQYEQGENLQSLFRDKSRVDQKYLEQIFFPIFEGLERIHALGFIHRDIKPANIYVRANGTPVLIDFGSARQTSQQHGGEMTTLVTHGYTPPEQYSPSYGEQGPWTDIYSLAATLYEGVTGRKPEESLSRSGCQLRNRPDSIIALKERDYPGYEQIFLDSIIAGLELGAEKRPQDLSIWSQQFAGVVPISIGHSDVATPISDDDRTRVISRSDAQAPLIETRNRNDESEDGDNTVYRPTVPPEKLAKQSNGKMFAILAVAGVACIGLAIGAYVMLSGAPDSEQQINIASLRDLPKPESALNVVSPKTQFLLQLDQMQGLASLYAEAHQLQPNVPELVDGITTLSSELVSAARQWNSSAHSSVTGRLLQISETLPAPVHSHQEVLDLVNLSEQLSNQSLVEQLLKSGQYLEPARNSVLDKINTLNADDANSVRATEEWTHMMMEIKRAVVSSIEIGDFERAALQVEAGLTLDPNDTQIQMLSSHLALRN